MDFKQIEAYVNVVRFRSFSKAADAMFFTQPTISTHISNLETELGVKLLDRKGRNVEMTPQGVIFYKYAIEMINSREQAVDALDINGDCVSGILEIQTSSIPGVAFLPELLADFRQVHSKVQYYVSLSDTQEVIDNIVNRQGEIGFVGRKESHTGLEYTKVFSDDMVLLAPASMNLPSEIKFEDAIKYPLLWRESGSATRKSFEDLASAMGFDKNSFVVAGLFNDLDPIVRCIEEGLGVSIISRRTAEVVYNDKLSIIDIVDFNDKRDFYMVTLRNAALSPVARAFKEFVLAK